MSGKKTKINYEISDDDEYVFVENKYSKSHKTFVAEIESNKEKKKKNKLPYNTNTNAPKVTSSKAIAKTSNVFENLVDLPECEIQNETEVNECYENNVDDELIEKLRNSSFDESFEFNTQDKR